MGTHEEILKTFTEDSLPDLDVATLGALEFFSHTDVPPINFQQFSRPLVVGSGNAGVAGKLLFDDIDAVFADEASYMQKLIQISSIDGAFLLSASGGKHAVSIAETLKERQIQTVLITNNENAQAKEFLSADAIRMFPKNREPYTYNTSTYMGMLLAKTSEDPRMLLEFIQSTIMPLIPKNLASYDAFYFIVPEEYTDVREMFKTKFDELFGPRLMARIFTYEQTKHAKTVIQGNRELFVSFGAENTVFGNPAHRLTIPLPEDSDYVAMMAIGYYFIGHIQKQFPPYFKERIQTYMREASGVFDSTLDVIVE